MDFNSGGMFNQDAGHNGFFWNGAEYKMIVNIREVLNADDKISEVLATLILNDSFSAVYDSIASFALYDVYDNILAKDDSTTSILCELMDSFGLKDDFTDLIVLAFLNEDFKLIEDAKMVAALLQSDDNFLAKDDMDIHAFYDLLEQFNMKDFEAFVKVIHSIHESFEMTDSEPEPKLAQSDWLIGVYGSQSITTRNAQSGNLLGQNGVIRNIVNGGDDNFSSKRSYTTIPKLDPAYDYLLPFGLKIDWGSSSLQIVPPAENVTVEVPNVDGSMILDTVYKDRLFEIVGYSEQNLTVQQKEDLKRKIANILASTKNESKKLTIQSRDISFDVRYSGEIEFKEANSWIRCKIPLLASVYGYSQFEETVVGSGNVKNDGSVDIGVRHIIHGPYTNPSFVMGAESYSWTGYIPQGSYLTIDHDMKSVWMTDDTGKRTNQLAKFSGNFQKIPPETSVVVTANSSLNQLLVTQWKNKLLW